MPGDGKPAPSRARLVVVIIAVLIIVISGRNISGGESTRPRAPKQLSQAYVYSDAAMKAAYDEAGGISNSPLGITVLDPDRTEAIKVLYHLATADEGTFNDDTSGFYDWLVEYFRWEMREPSKIDYDTLLEHTKRQIQIAASQPQSDIGRRIRTLEAGKDPLLPGSGPEVYWQYLFYPYWKLLFNGIPMQYELAMHEFYKLSEGYKVSQITSGDTTDFGEFLIQNGDILWAGMR